MKKLQRTLSFVLVVLMFVSLVPMGTLKTDAASNIVINGVDIGYSAGSYFTKNGSSCKNSYWSNGRCHKNGVCESSTHSQCNCMRYWPTGNPSTCKVDLLSVQCLAFARYCQWKVYGSFATSASSSYADLTGALSKAACTASTLKSKLMGCAPATHVRMPSPHSISILSTSDSNVTFADCNSDGYCKVRVISYSWADFATYVQGKGGINYAYSRKGVSPSPAPTPECTCSASHAGQYVCTTSSASLIIRSGHGSTYSKVGSIPSGAVVTVTKASGTGAGDWAHVTYNGVSGYASMQYLKKQENNNNNNNKTHADTPSIHWWISETEYGGDPAEFKAGTRYYLCYRLYDSVSGKDWDEVSSNSYSVTLSYKDSGGTILHSYKFDYDKSWISVFFGKAGDYTAKVVLDGDFLYTGETTFHIDDNPIKINVSNTSANVTLGGTSSFTAYAWTTGYYDNSTVLSWSKSNDNVSCAWGEWNNGKIPLTITGKARGTTKVTVSVKDKESGTVLNSCVINVTVDGKKFTVSYNANGGSGAPSSQTKYYNETLTLSTAKPTRTGYTFLGWATSSTATSAGYTAGSKYTADSNITLYAVWEANSYTVKYDANGGTGAPSSQTKKHNVDLTLSTAKPTRTGYTFLGWATSSTATSAGYSPGSKFKSNISTTLYAVWEKNKSEPVIVPDNVTANLVIESKSAKAGETVEVMFYLDSAVSLKAIGINNISYDTSKLELVSGEWIVKNSFLADFDISTKSAVAVFGENEDIKGNLLKLTFKVKNTAADGIVEIKCNVSAKTLKNGTEMAVDLAVITGKITIASVFCGDVDNNQRVDSDDAIYLLYSALFGSKAYPLNQEADFNGDGKVTSDDAIYLLYHTLFGGASYPLK